MRGKYAEQIIYEEDAISEDKRTFNASSGDAVIRLSPDISLSRKSDSSPDL